jgi:hypothetical protein
LFPPIMSLCLRADGMHAFKEHNRRIWRFELQALTPRFFNFEIPRA